MSDFFYPVTEQASRKLRPCVACDHAIERGEVYCRQAGFFYGGFQTNHFHRECFDSLDGHGQPGYFQFSPGESEPPDRDPPVRTMQEALAEATQAA